MSDETRSNDETAAGSSRRSFLGTLGVGTAALAATASGVAAAPAAPARHGQTVLTSFNVALQETGGIGKEELDRVMAEVNEEIKNKVVKEVLIKRLNQAGLEGTPFEIAQHTQFSLHGEADTGGG
jgi:hypothetical protein